LRILVRPEIFVYAAFFIFTTAFFLLNAFTQNGGQDIVGHYLKLNGPRLVWTLILVFIALFAHGVVLWVKAAIRQVDPATLVTRQNAGLLIRQTRAVLKNLVTLGIPFVLAFSSLSLALGPLNVFNATRLRDELLFSWDVWLTGTFPPLTLSSFQYPGWFVSTVESPFFYLVPVLTIFGAYLFIARPHVFREAAGAFFLAAIIMFAGWFTFPVLSPNDRFVDNVYNLPVPPETQQYVERYQPQKEVLAFWEKIYASRENMEIFPTTAIPSAHVVWAVFLIYYSWRVWKWLLVFSLPFGLLATFGTNLFAAHYFVDILTGVVCGAGAIFIARWLARKKDAYLQSAQPAIQ